MAKIQIVAGTTSKLLDVFIQDSSSTTGAGLTGLAFNTASLTGYYYREGAASATAITLATMTLGTWATGGFVVIDGTNMPGCYQLGIPDAAIAAGAKSVLVMLKGATNMAQLVLEVELTATNNQDAVRGGMTALPNANAGAAGGMVVLGANATAISFTAGMTVSNAGGSALTLSSGGGNGSGLVASGNGTGSGAVFTSGAGATGDGITATAASTAGHGLSATGAGAGNGIFGQGGNGGHGDGAHFVGGSSGQGDGIRALGGSAGGNGIFAQAQAGNDQGMDVSGFGSGAGLRVRAGATGIGLNVIGGATSGAGVTITTTSGDGVSITPTAGSALVATANGASKHGIVATGGTAGTSDGIKAVAGTGGVPIRGDLTGNVTGNLSGSVGSVTGAVGSVTGNVGGSVASVVGAVGSVTAGVTLAIGAVDATALDATAVQKLADGILPKKNTAFTFEFLMVLSADHVSPAPGLVPTGTVSINGAAFGAVAGVITEISGGTYKFAAAAGDMNGKTVLFKFSAATADDAFVEIVTSGP